MKWSTESLAFHHVCLCVKISDPEPQCSCPELVANLIMIRIQRNSFKNLFRQMSFLLFIIKTVESVFATRCNTLRLHMYVWKFCYRTFLEYCRLKVLSLLRIFFNKTIVSERKKIRNAKIIIVPGLNKGLQEFTPVEIPTRTDFASDTIYWINSKRRWNPSMDRFCQW